MAEHGREELMEIKRPETELTVTCPVWLIRSPKLAGMSRIYIHGEKEFELTVESRKDGILILVAVVEETKSRGEELGVPFDIDPVGPVESQVDGVE